MVSKATRSINPKIFYFGMLPIHVGEKLQSVKKISIVVLELLRKNLGGG